MYRSVSSSIRLPVSVLTPECRDILDQLWPLKLQNKDSGMELVQGRMWIKVVCLQNNTLLLNPATHLGGDNMKQSFLSTETTQWPCIAHLYTWEERERQLKCFEVTCPLMDRNTKHAHLYTYLTVEKSFRICYKAQSANDHPPSLKETLYGRNRLQTKQYFIWRNLTFCNCLYFRLCNCWLKLKTA